jgi:hypothetical protein
MAYGFRLIGIHIAMSINAYLLPIKPNSEQLEGGKPRVPFSGIAELPKRKKFNKSRGLSSPRDFYFGNMILFKRRWVTFKKGCRCDPNSRCPKEGGCCDLHCYRLLDMDDSEFDDKYDKIDPLADWWMKEETGLRRETGDACR